MHNDTSHGTFFKPQARNDDQAWAHWDYSPEEWAIFDRVDCQAALLRYWLPVLIPPTCFFVCIVILILLSVVVFPIFMPGVVGIAFLLSLAVMIVVLVTSVAGLYSYREAKKRHQARQKPGQPHRVTFSAKGVWEAGTYFPLRGVNTEALQSVRMTSQPAVLHFRLREEFSNGTQTSVCSDTILVLVPRNREEEAAQLMERFLADREAKKQAREEAKKRLYNPPEPL